MRTLLLNSTYEPISFITFRKMIKLVVNNKVDRVSAWNSGIKHGTGYDLICGARLEFYSPLFKVKHAGVVYEFCSKECAEIFKVDPLEFLHPSIVRLKKYAPRHIKRRKYNRIGVFRRDKHTCQYCGKTRSPSDLTIDHVLPRDMGGDTSWGNCVACCFDCNNRKANRTPKMAGMKLLHKPFALTQSIWSEYNVMKHKHEDWQIYIGK
jgi:YHS domain-containing protein